MLLLDKVQYLLIYFIVKGLQFLFSILLFNSQELMISNRFCTFCPCANVLICFDTALLYPSNKWLHF